MDKEICIKEYIPNDPVNHPSHYTSGGIECIEALEAAYGKETAAHFCMGNAFKYCFRLGKKDDIAQDANKAIWYLNRVCKYHEEGVV